MPLRELTRTARTFHQARWGLRFSTREQLEQWQSTQLATFLAHRLPTFPFYRDAAATTLAALPIIDKPTVRAHFADFNAYGVTLDHAETVACSAERDRNFRPTIGGLTVGVSSGTSGTRSVFLVSPEERQRWAGLVLGRLLTPQSLTHIMSPWQRPLRIAFFLRANSNLYESVSSRRVHFTFCDLTRPMATHVAALNNAPPDVLVAPPTILAQLAAAQLDGRLRAAPRQVVSVAEVLESDDRDVSERAFAVPLQEVYQATEGLLAISCPAGRLHLNEEFLHIEPEWLDAERRRFHPIVTPTSPVPPRPSSAIASMMCCTRPGRHAPVAGSVEA